MIGFTVEVAGQVQLHRAIKRFSDGVSDLRPVWPEMISTFHAIEKEQFHTEGGAGESGQWAALSPAYAKWKGGGKGILERSGRLMASLTGGSGSEVEETKESLRIGSGVKYGIFHQLGTSRLPQRKVIDLSERNKRRLMKVLQGYLVGLERSAQNAASAAA